LPSRNRQLALVALAALVALLVWRLGRSEERETRRPRQAATEEPSPAAEAPRGAKAPRKQPSPNSPGDSDTVPASLACHQGDVWIVAANTPIQKRAECGDQRCRDGACEQPDAQPCREPLEGRCDGSIVKLCMAGRALRIDCASQGLRCAMGDEGAECVPEVPRGERCEGAARCEGDVLVRCEAGRRVLNDCSAERASCGLIPGEREVGCVRIARPGGDCGPCGCPPDPSHQEARCDGRDDDADGLVDEGLACGPVPVIAFVARGGGGETSHAPEDIDAELARANALFTPEGEYTTLSFELDSLVWLDDPALLSVSSGELSALAADSRLHPSRPGFYVPLLFTDELTGEGGVPRAGVSTLPNGSCGGVHWGSSPAVGLLAVAKSRAPTTVAHELGHFLGLCHTHETRADAPVIAADVGGSLAACGTACSHEGDGICDTPFDPGPEACSYDNACRTLCSTRDDPDPENLMSYYTECRRVFSPDQMALMEHTLALRRGWHACLHGACPCQLGTASCPAGMSCRPLEDGRAACGLDGPRAPGADCDATSDCSQGGQCVRDLDSGQQRCARACLDSTPGCRCTPFGERLNLCAEDLE
jgi:hypothetical protein